MTSLRTGHTCTYIASFFVYLTVLVLVESEEVPISQAPSMIRLASGTNFSLTCSKTFESADVAKRTRLTWQMGKSIIAEGGIIHLHNFLSKDSFGRSLWNTWVTYSNENLTKLSTLHFPILVTKSAGVYSCLGHSVTVTVGNAKILTRANQPVEIECDGIGAARDAGKAISSPISWYKSDTPSGTPTEIFRCGAERFSTMPVIAMEVTTTAGTTAVPTAAAATVSGPMAAFTGAAPGVVNTLASISTKSTTTTTITTTSTTTVRPSQPAPIVSESSKRVRCGNLSKIIIDQVTIEDAGTYTCNYTFDATNDYSWSTDLDVKVKPNPPGIPEKINSTQDSIFIKWAASNQTASNAVLNYSVQYMTLHSFTVLSAEWIGPDNLENSNYIKNKTNIPNTELQTKIEGLEGSTVYVARVWAHNEMGATNGSTNSMLRTSEIPPPIPIRLDPISESDRIIFMWSVGAKGKFTDFVFKLYVNMILVDNKTIPKNNDTDANYYKHTVYNLTTLTEYCYNIQSRLHTGGGYKYSANMSCHTASTDIAAPDAPQIVNITKVSVVNSTGTLRILFIPPLCFVRDPDCLDSYKLQYRMENQTFHNRTFNIRKDVASSEYNLTGLKMGHIYQVQLAGVVKSKKYLKNITGNFSSLFTSDKLLEMIPTTTSKPVASTDASPVTSTAASPGTLPPDSNEDEVIIIVVCVLSVLLISSIIIIVIVYKKRKDRGNMSVEMEDDLWIDLNTPLLGPANMGYVESEYENVGIDAWAEHCKYMHANSDIKFTEEYESICQPPIQDITWTNSLEPANLPKNRYNNIIAYDHTRVILKTQPGIVHSDYINANYIDSYDRIRAFIATQGPLPNTIEDFWRMVWENNSNVIVMITNVYEKHKKKCEQYWPDSGEAKYGRMTVTLLGVEELAYWTIRRFTIKSMKVTKKKNQVAKIIVQYHYTEWPDHGIPEYTLPVLGFVKRSCSSNPAQAGPIVVHCSAGVGRTGTFIVLEAMMKQIMQKRTVNVQGFLRHTRGLRNHLVQTEDQYIFIHDALLNFIESGGGTDIHPKKFRTAIDELDTNFDSSGETVLEKQYKTIVRWSPSGHLTTCPLLDVNQNKNRNLAYIPLDNSSRVKLPKIAGENGSDYINATYLHGYFQNKEFIITQHPAAHTEYDFWRMVWDQNSMTLVMLSNIGEEDCVTFYRPKGEPTDWSHKSSFKLTFTEENLDTLDMIVRDFQLESKQDDYEMLTRMFSITCWPEAYTETQSYSEGVFQFIEVVNKWHSTKRNQTGPIIVIDKYGGKAAAQFCALYTLYNQYHHDTTVDLYSLAYLYHMKRPGVWETQNDYRLLYNSVSQICEPQLEDEKANDGNANGDFPMNTFANVRRINTLPRSPEHMVRTDTL